MVTFSESTSESLANVFSEDTGESLANGFSEGTGKSLANVFSEGTGESLANVFSRLPDWLPKLINQWYEFPEVGHVINSRTYVHVMSKLLFVR